MIVDIYNRITTYPYYDPNAIEVEDEVEMFVQQVDTIMTTPKGSLLGDPDFGVSLDAYLWRTHLGSGNIRQDILQQINKYCIPEMNDITFDLEVSFIQGEIWDTILVDLIIDGTKVAGYSVAP